jgi:hypothetical protein
MMLHQAALTDLYLRHLVEGEGQGKGLKGSISNVKFKVEVGARMEGLEVLWGK